MISEQKSILNTLLGAPKLVSGGSEGLYKCPFCNHHKKKLQIHYELGQFNCWVCNTKGRSLITLLKKLKVTDPNIYAKFKSNKNNVLIRKDGYPQDIPDKELVSLPKEFKPLYIKRDDPDYKHAIRYLFKRGLTVQDILKYRIGYCDKGPYSGMVIIPSYDANNQLNFFVGRSYYKEATMKHKNPNVSKNIIGFENLINWKLPIVLVEGAFDAISIKRNVIPLFGKKILRNLRDKILLEKVKELYLCLDNDAKQDALKLADYFSKFGVTVYFVNLKEKDPNEIGFHKIHTIMNETETFGFEDMIKMKLAL